MANVDTSLPSETSGAAARLAARHAHEHPLKLYGGWFCPFVQRAWITLCEKKIPHQYVEINPYKKEPEFLEMNPRGLVPTLAVPVGAQGKQQKPLFESAIICEYLEDAYSDEAKYGPALLPADPYERARARLWIDHINTRVIPAFYKLLQHTPEKPYGVEQARDELHGHIRNLTEQMDSSGPWFLGEQISLVDISLAPWAKRLWLVDHYKPGGLGIPKEGQDGIWRRWRTWMEALENRQSVQDTWSDDERYTLAYKSMRTLDTVLGKARRNQASRPPSLTTTTSRTMHDPAASRFAPQSKTTHERLSTNTVGLVALSDFRKRRAEVLEQQEREAREAAYSGAPTPDRSQTGTPDNAGSGSVSGGGQRPARKKKKQGKKLLSFDDDDGEDDTNSRQATATAKNLASSNGDDSKAKFKANAAVGIVPKAATKSALRREAAEREALRRDFVRVQEAVKATEIAMPFVFYDGANTPGGTVRMKKGDFVWVFLDKSRKVGAELGVGDQANSRRAWARVGVDDLMLHYDFYFFIVNKSVGPGGRRLFDFSDEAPSRPEPPSSENGASETDRLETPRLETPASKAAAALLQPDMDTLEGASEDATVTKVVDRRWYERNKHIYPASTWQEFDPEKDYAAEVRKDTGGNTFFFSK
ncbi:Uncharacterized protein TCAP_03276 [Tolypocladium capitatum]|uniref:Glutathione S-transferase omega-1 n=1 Tax=Tolypocladium capitatum TaxID=45235 RepID=A0A2K3QGW3_9HYPO|nr:Uncharacterized protein TCAP_03276 [Tolypocladium capitatum]